MTGRLKLDLKLAPLRPFLDISEQATEEFDGDFNKTGGLLRAEIICPTLKQLIEAVGRLVILDPLLGDLECFKAVEQAYAKPSSGNAAPTSPGDVTSAPPLFPLLATSKNKKNRKSVKDVENDSIRIISVDNKIRKFPIFSPPSSTIHLSCHLCSAVSSTLQGFMGVPQSMSYKACLHTTLCTK